MSLTTRLSAFFLAALALVLLGFSLTLYLLARGYLHGQADERLGSALDRLEATAEDEHGGLEWEPRDRTLGEVRWQVRDGAGTLVDRSANHGDAPWSDAPPSADGDRGEREATADGVRWKVGWRRLRSATVAGGVRPGHHAELVLTAGVRLDAADRTLRTLAAALAGLSLLLWTAAALLGRWLCRRALAPVARMAEAARGMGARDLSARLPEPATRDELADLCRSFNDLLGRLQEAFARQRRFTGDASHQLRTPLAAVLGQVEVALRRDRPASEYRDVLALVRSQADHLRRVVESLLFLARADSDAELGTLESVDLAAWAANHLARWSDHPRGPDLRMEAAADGGLWVRAQVPLLGQLADNLLENACKYSAPGSPVVVRLARGDGGVTMTIEDQGFGIAAADLPHVFEPFYRSAEARRQGRPGVGLGLAVARRIAAAFGGVLTVDSAEGRGSRFTLRLPAVLDRVAKFPTGYRTDIDSPLSRS